MELSAWQCQRNPVPCTGTVSLLPPSWDTISALYSHVLRMVSKFPGRRRLVLYLAYRGATVKVDLGDVKAAGAVCALGLGIGLGTLFVYKLYHRYIRPFIDTLHYPDPEDSVCSDLSFLLDSSDSGVDGAKSDNSSCHQQQLPALLSCLQYGVALGGKGVVSSLSTQHQPHNTQTLVDSVRMRRSGTRPKPVRRTRRQRDNSNSSHSSAPVGLGLLSPPGVFLQANFRDSFYSTAESGFETLPEFNEDEDYDDDEKEGGRRRSQSPRDISVCSGQEKVERFLSSSSGGRTNPSPPGKDALVRAWDGSGSDIALTVLHNHERRLTQTAQSSPARKVDNKRAAGQLKKKLKSSSYPHSLNYDSDPSLDASESIQSFNSSSSIGEELSWDGDVGGEGEGRTCPLPPSSSCSDREFRQSLMQRVHEWTMSVEEEDPGTATTPPPPLPVSHSPTQVDADLGSPTTAMELRQVRRSRSLDRQLADPPLFLPDVVEISSNQQATIKHLEGLETDFHDIQDEFESIMSKLHDLIERGKKEVAGVAGGTGSEDKPSPQGYSQPRAVRPCSFPRQLHAHSPSRDSSKGGGREGRGRSRSPLSRHIFSRTQATRWERLPRKKACSRSRSRSRSNSSSRASSVDFSWDCAEVGGIEEEVHDGGGGSVRTEGGVGGPAGDCYGGGVVALSSLEEHSVNDQAVCCGGEQAVCSIGEAMSISQCTEREWKGEAHKAQTILQGYSAIPDLLQCQRLRQVKGDHYCLLRGVFFQAVVEGYQVSRQWPGPVSLIDQLHSLYSDNTSGLDQWEFAGRSPVGGQQDVLNKMTYCILALYATVEDMVSLPTREEREARAMQVMSRGQQQDLELLDGLKLLMMLTLCRYSRTEEEEGGDGDGGPALVQALFAREATPDLVSLVRNRLNCVGQSVGIDQTELCLLAETLGVRVRILRLHHHGLPDFDCQFPPPAADQMSSSSSPSCPTVCLLTEDDRCYSVPAP